MTRLISYSVIHREPTIQRIVCFFGLHATLLGQTPPQAQKEFANAETTLASWLLPSHELYMILYEETIVGFLHICYRGDIAVWIEDIFVDEAYRNRGIATQAIRLCEDMIKDKPGYTAICLDVVPRNRTALALYHKLGYDNLSMVTVRKELYANKRDQKESVFGFEFNC